LAVYRIFRKHSVYESFNPGWLIGHVRLSFSPAGGLFHQLLFYIDDGAVDDIDHTF
jgi:hypothetical protein